MLPGIFMANCQLTVVVNGVHVYSRDPPIYTSSIDNYGFPQCRETQVHNANRCS